MNEIEPTLPGTPPPSPPPPRGGPPRGLLIALGFVAFLAVGVGAYLLGRRGAGQETGSTGQASSGGPASGQGDYSGGMVQSLPPAPDKPTQMEVSSEPALPAFWMDVYSPSEARQALTGNAWLQEQLKKPLGQGFVGGWAAFLGTSGEDLGASFKGAVFDVVADRMLGGPFRVVWFSGEQRAGTPAIIVPDPAQASVAAYESMNGVARRNGMTADSCPGGEGEVPEGGFMLNRWLIAEQALWAGRKDDRLVFARHPAVVLQGLCAERVELQPPEGVDVEVGFSPEPLGREAQLLAHVLGLGPGLRMQFAIEGNRLVGRGLAGPLAGEPRLGSASLSDDLLRLIPEDTPVLLALQLQLPEKLDRDTLKAFWSGGGAEGKLLTRQVALVWTPRGDDNLPTEVALLWGRPEDAQALGEIFAGGNTMERATLCNHHVLASTGELLGRLRKACEGKSPNMLNAAAPVVQGLRAPGSVAFGLNTGRLLGMLLADGYWSEARVDSNKPMPRAAPPEIEATRRDLETLPYIGLRGTVQGDSLVPGGFGS